MKLYCYASGEMEIGTEPPEGTIVIFQGVHSKCRDIMLAHGQLSAEKGTAGERFWVVPGVPEAETEEAKFQILMEFCERVAHAKAAGGKS